MAEFTVYTTPCCAFTQRVTTLLNYKSVKFTLEVLPNEKPEWFKEASPNGETPVIKHNDKYMADSLKIMEYIEEQHAEPQVFHDPAREVLKFIEEEFRPAFSRVMMASAPPMQKEWRPKLMAALDKMENMLAENSKEGEPTYLVGSSYSAADIAITPFMVRFPHLKYYRDISLSNDKHAHILKYIQTLSSHPAFAPLAYPEIELRKWYRTRIPRLPPLSTNPLQHVAFRKRTAQLQKLAQQLSTEEDLEKFSKAYHLFDKVDAVHYRFEEEVIFPMVEGMSEGSTHKPHDQHTELDKFNHSLSEKLANKNVEEAKAAFLEFYPKFDEHWGTEEAQLLPITSKIEGPDQFPIFKKIWRSSKVEDQIELCVTNFAEIPLTFQIYVLEVLEPVQIDQYVFNMWNVLTKDPEFQEDWRAVQHALQSRLTPETWAMICERNPEVAKEVEVPKPAENAQPSQPTPPKAEEVKKEEIKEAKEEVKKEEAKPSEPANEQKAVEKEAPKSKEKQDKSKKSGGCCIVM